MIELVDFNEIYQQEEKQAKGNLLSLRGSRKVFSTTGRRHLYPNSFNFKAVAEPEEPQTQEENAVAESETQEEVVQLSGEVVVEKETTESEANEIVEAIKEEEKKSRFRR